MLSQALSRHTLFKLSLLAWLACSLHVFAFAQDPQPSATPLASPQLVRPTTIVRPSTTSNTDATAPVDIVTPTVPDIAQPTVDAGIYGRQGILIETLDGRIVAAQAVDETFNPASAVKLATALDALRTFGPDYRFTTAIWMTGTLDKATGTINGDLIISGRDPSFHYEHAIMLARELNALGIRTVTGNLIVAPKFTMNFDWSSQHSGDMLYNTLDTARRSAAAMRAWNDERVVLGDTVSLQVVPSVTVMGAVHVDAVPPGAQPLLIHRSSKLVDVLKVLLCYSNNFMAERIGDTLGGPLSLQNFLINQIGINPAEVRLSSTSGLGINRFTPRAMMKVFRALRDELAKHNLSPSDILPVAGVDPGTLEKRYTNGPSRGSVIAKTGTLVRTDGGASALVGQMHTASGETLLFVILNQRGSIWRFRENQDAFITQVQNTRGGPSPFDYRPVTLAMRLSDTEFNATKQAGKDEYEPGVIKP